MGSRIRISATVISVAVATALAGAASAAPNPISSASSAGVLTSSAAVSSPTGAHYTAGRYIVTFADEPVASYTGYKAGFPATQPKPGRHINPRSSAVVKWQRHLTAKHDQALAKVGAEKFYDYTITNNGVAVRLTAQQAFKLAKIPGVVALSKDRKATPTTNFSPEFLGLDAPDGLWDQLPGGDADAGAGVVVGIIDTGIWPESESFAGGTGIPVPADWHGKCVSGEQFDKNLACNDKLIGARYFLAGFGRARIANYDYLSPRDFSGHGSHTASTAAGNHGVSVNIDGNDLGTASGMAPGAKVAMYKVCWEGRPGVNPGCFDSDSVAAINTAVSTSSTTPSAVAPSRAFSTRWSRPSAVHPTPASTRRTPLATADRVPARSTTRPPG